MTGAAMSTSFSDAVLAGTAYYAAYHLYSFNNFASVAFLSVGLAASAGVVRFALNNPDANVITIHKMMAFISTVLIGPFIAASYFLDDNQNIIKASVVAAGLVIAVKFFDVVLKSFGKTLATSIVSGLGVITVVLWNVWTANAFGAVGSMLYVFAGLVIGTDGEMYGIPCVDIFHYALALANMSLFWGLR